VSADIMRTWRSERMTLVAAESPSITTPKGSDVSGDMGYFRRMLKDRFFRVMTTLSSRASHPLPIRKWAL
jgi:hypothetical protein